MSSVRPRSELHHPGPELEPCNGESRRAFVKVSIPVRPFHGCSPHRRVVAVRVLWELSEEKCERNP